MLSGGKVMENIYLCPDKVYRWTYEFDILRTPTIFFTICKVVIGSFGAVYVFVLLLGLFIGSADDPKEI